MRILKDSPVCVRYFGEWDEGHTSNIACVQTAEEGTHLHLDEGPWDSSDIRVLLEEMERQEEQL